MNTPTFQKWLKFIRYLPEVKEPNKIFDHIEKMMRLSNFSKSILHECVKEFFKDRVVGQNNSFSK